MVPELTELKDKILGLPIEDRIELAESLWESVEGSNLFDSKIDMLELSVERDLEIQEENIQMIGHEEVMKEAKQILSDD
ncbi:MAG: hypothetical protein HRT89_05820 [Lentisphaeria bacterium]|nr:hypothetical protein [Lentisphaeria bacterium]NQZ67569.1 hypothetical protein [Lentisphaeria bacterium]